MPLPNLAALVRALLVWLLIMAIETAQGAVRELLASPAVEFAVRQVAVFVSAAIIFGITWICMRWMRIRTTLGSLAVGVLWVLLTLAVEFGLGRALGLSWSRLFSDYDLLHGGLMPLGLAFMALTPWLVRRLQLRRARVSAPATAAERPGENPDGARRPARPF